MKTIAIAAILSLSTLCLAQEPTTPAAVTPAAVTPAAPAPTAKEVEQKRQLLEEQIQTAIATRQVYFERLKGLTEFQKWYDSDQKIQALRQQQQQLNATASDPRHEGDKKTEEEFKAKMKAEAAREAKDQKKPKP